MMSPRACSAITVGVLALTLAIAPLSGTRAQSQSPEPAGPQPPVSPTPPKPPVPDEPPPEDGGPKAYVYTADEAIEFFRQRVAKTPGDYISLRYLGEMYERKARETGDFAAFGKAEETLRRAVALNPEIARARASLAAVLCSRHKFAEGLEIARALVRQYPKDIDAQSTMGDALLELGRYDEAESTYRNLERLTPAPLPEVLARLANLAELRGDVDGALALMRRALDDVRKNRLPKDAAWFLARSGDMLFDAGAGKLDEAEAAYRAVPEGTDARHDATFGLGKVLAARGNDAQALEQFRKAVAIGPDLHMLAGLGDLYVRTGDLAKAEETFRRLEQEAVKQAEHARDLVYFYADHDRELPRALELARKELASRADVFTRDALAWALLKNGRAEEAALPIVEALKVGTKDAKVHYHAGLIYARLGDRDRARTHLTAALATNPHFSILGPDDARRALAALDRK